MNLCVTADRHWAIGKDGRPLVTIPADRQMFLKETAGKVVVMGRRTLEGLPGGQPFGNRVNIVLTHDMQYKVKGAVVCHSLEETLKALEDYNESDIYFIGGESQRIFTARCRERPAADTASPRTITFSNSPTSRIPVTAS